MAEPTTTVVLSALTAKAGVAGTMPVLATAKIATLSPMIGAVALGKIILFEWWKGNRDARKFSSAH